jgi:DNA-binding response OmpR family regulator
VDGRILLVEGVTAVSRAVAATLRRLGYSVVVTRTCEEAGRQPGPFDCGVFAERLSDGNGISLAGWLLAEDRVRCVVFFGDSVQKDVRLRASNLGSFVHKTQGIYDLAKTIREALRDLDAHQQAVGAEFSRDGSFRPEVRTGPRRTQR